MIAVGTWAWRSCSTNQKQARASRCWSAQDDFHISTGTVAEELIVAARRNVGEEMARLIDWLGLEIVTVTPAAAHRSSLCAMGQGRP